jgi:hypothetical protein
MSCIRRNFSNGANYARCLFIIFENKNLQMDWNCCITAFFIMGIY